MTKTNSGPIGNVAMIALNSLIHCFHHLVSTVLNICAFEFKICFGFRDSCFVFFKRHLRLTESVEPLRVNHNK